MSGALRILQVSAFFPAHGGGIEVVAGELARRLPTAGVQLRWMAGGPVDEWPADLPEVSIDRVAAGNAIERRLGMPAPLWGPGGVCLLWRRVGECDLVHVHDFLYQPTLVAFIFAALRGRPVLLTQHIGEIPYRSRFARALLKALNRSVGAFVLGRAGQVVFVGRPVQQYFERFVRFRRPPLLLPNGVDHLRFHPPARPPGGPVLRLLFVGRFVEKKGVHLADACRALPGVHWTFVGHGPLAPAPAPAVEVTGRLPAAAVAERYCAADLLVLPSTGEGFPLVLQEALACGTPVLVSTEVFDAFPQVDERCVFHVELRCSDPAAALRQRLTQLLAEPGRLRAARGAAAALARQWSWELCVARYRDLYGALMATAKSA